MCAVRTQRDDNLCCRIATCTSVPLSVVAVAVAFAVFGCQFACILSHWRVYLLRNHEIATQLQFRRLQIQRKQQHRKQQALKRKFSGTIFLSMCVSLLIEHACYINYVCECKFAVALCSLILLARSLELRWKQTLRVENKNSQKSPLVTFELNVNRIEC